MSKVEPVRIRENTVNIAISDKVMESIKHGEEFAVYIGTTKVVLKYYKEDPKSIFCPGCGTKISENGPYRSFVCPICGTCATRETGRVIKG